MPLLVRCVVPVPTGSGRITFTWTLLTMPMSAVFGIMNLLATLWLRRRNDISMSPSSSSSSRTNPTMYLMCFSGSVRSAEFAHRVLVKQLTSDVSKHNWRFPTIHAITEFIAESMVRIVTVFFSWFNSYCPIDCVCFRCSLSFRFLVCYCFRRTLLGIHLDHVLFLYDSHLWSRCSHHCPSPFPAFSWCRSGSCFWVASKCFRSREGCRSFRC